MSEKKYDVLSEVHSIDDNLNEIIKATTEQLPVAKQRGKDDFMNAVDSISHEVADKVQDCSLITPNDVARLKKAQTFLLQTYTDVRQYRPMINKLTTVLSDSHFPTVDSKFWQAKSEAEVHFNELQRETFKWQRARVDLNELDYKIESTEKMLGGSLTPVGDQTFDPNLVRFDLERLKIKRSQYEFEVKQLEKSIKYRIEEITDWAKIAENFEVNCQYDTRNPDSHLAETKLKMLTYQIENAEDEEQKEMYARQRDTLIELIKAKTKEIKKKES